MKQLLRIATRKSVLALWQANYIKDQLLTFHPELTIELVEMTTAGDKNLQDPLYKTGGKGLFVKELEQAILAGQADIAVHSMKDMPVEIPADLTIAATSKREDARDVLLTKQKNLASLMPGSIVGTTSLRRMSQLLALRPDLEVRSLRGNIDTRLRRLDEGMFDAIILAAAGLHRLGLEHRIAEYFPFDQFLPAGGQGALAIESRVDDQKILKYLEPLNHKSTQICVSAERALNRRLQGGCQVPIGAYATIMNDQLRLQGFVGSVDGKDILRAVTTGQAKDAEHLGIQIAEDLLALGAQDILDAVNHE